jgi:hypothetical protein
MNLRLNRGDGSFIAVTSIDTGGQMVEAYVTIGGPTDGPTYVLNGRGVADVTLTRAMVSDLATFLLRALAAE